AQLNRAEPRQAPTDAREAVAAGGGVPERELRLEPVVGGYLDRNDVREGAGRDVDVAAGGRSTRECKNRNAQSERVKPHLMPSGDEMFLNRTFSGGASRGGVSETVH